MPKKHVEGQAKADDRKCFQNADAEEQERENVGTSFRLARDGLDRFAGDETVADGRSKSHARHDKSERDERRRPRLTLEKSTEYPFHQKSSGSSEIDSARYTMASSVKTNACTVPTKKLKNWMKNGRIAAVNDRLKNPIEIRDWMIDAMIRNSSSPTKILKNRRAPQAVTGRTRLIDDVDREEPPKRLDEMLDPFRTRCI